jgi:hypothetical protein
LQHVLIPPQWECGGQPERLAILVHNPIARLNNCSKTLSRSGTDRPI